MNIITLQNEHITVKIAPEKGSNMFSFRYKTHELIYTDPALLETSGFTGNFVLFPTPNRVKDSTYQWNGKTVVQRKHGALRDIHGLVYDEPWNVVDQTQTSATTSISLTDPFACTLQLRYELTANGVSTTYTVTNEGEEEMPFGFALHPYFARLSGDDQTYITVPSKSWMESPADTLLPTGKLIDVSDKPYNLNTPRPIGELSLDHVFTDLISGKYAEIQYTTLGFKVVLKTSEDFTHTVVYTGHKNAVCIENQTCSTDAINLYNRGFENESHILNLPPKKSHSGTVAYFVSALS